MSTPYPQPLPPASQPKRPWYKKKRWMIPLGFFALCVIVTPFTGGSDGTSSASGVTVTPAAESSSATTTAGSVAKPAATATAATLKPAPKPKKTKSLTAGQKQAVSKAEEYLDFQAFSRKGLIKQLKYEKFTTSEATFAVDHVKVNWNAQAVKKAEEYLDTQSFSRSGLITQLKFEGFTSSQAKHGVGVAYH